MAKADFDPKPAITDAVTDAPAADSSDRAGKPSPGAGADLESVDAPSGDVSPARMPAEDDLHAAVTSLPPEALSNIDSTLDQLTSAADLFEVSAFDLDA